MKILKEEYVDTGKIGGIFLSEVSAATIERAVKVAKIVYVEAEVSLFSTDVLSNGVAQACARHGIPIVAYVYPTPFLASRLMGNSYSPIGRGMLSGEIKKPEDIP